MKVLASGEDGRIGVVEEGPVRKRVKILAAEQSRRGIVRSQGRRNVAKGKRKDFLDEEGKECCEGKAKGFFG